MFDLLKKKISSFVSAITGKEQAKPAEPVPALETPVEPAAPEPAAIPPVPTQEKPIPAEPKIIVEEKTFFPHEPRPVREEPAFESPLEDEKPQAPAVAEQIEKIVHEVTDIDEAFEKAEVEEQKKPVQTPQTERQIEMPKLVYVEDASKQRKLAPSLGLVSQVTSFFTQKVTISEDETKQLFEELEVALLESDVSVDTAHALVEELRKRLVGKQVEKSKVQEEIKNVVSLSLQTLLEQPRFDFFSKIREAQAANRPAIVVFFGPNGAGKTTTIAKMANLLKKNGFSSVIAASDTFRAAAIEQAVHHGAKLDVHVVKHNYGADPAAVAFDAIKHATANKVDVVLVDTAGRQETNKNLLEELRKIVRVAKPDAKLFVGESIAGHALIDQLKTFDEAVGIDAVILTKIDCDAKGGNSLSIARETRVPVIFMGVGQGYDELVPFDPTFIVNKVLEN